MRALVELRKSSLPPSILAGSDEAVRLIGQAQQEHVKRYGELLQLQRRLEEFRLDVRTTPKATGSGCRLTTVAATAMAGYQHSVGRHHDGPRRCL